MAQLTIPQLVGLARSVGLSPQAAATSAAVAMAESSGRVDALGDSGNSRGPWQVYGPAHPQFNHDRLLSDPAYSAQVMKSISEGGRDWSPWTTYNTGAYKQFLPAAQRAAQSGGAPLAAAGGLPGASATVDVPAPAGADLSQVAQIAASIEANKPQPQAMAVPAPPVMPNIRLPGGAQFQLPPAPSLGAPVAKSGSITDEILRAAMMQGQPQGQQVSAEAQGMPSFLGGGRRDGYVFPLPNVASIGRTDRGQDMEADKPYSQTVAVGSGTVVRAGTGFPGIVIRLDRPYGGHELVFYGHNSAVLVKPGQRVRAGQPVGKTGGGPGGSPTHTEIGFTNSPDAIPAPEGPGHWAPTGQAFHNLLTKIRPDLYR